MKASVRCMWMVIQMTGLLIFFYGFFLSSETPIRPKDQVMSLLDKQQQNQITTCDQLIQNHRNESFDRLIIMIVDALRSDFLPSVFEPVELKDTAEGPIYTEPMMPFTEGQVTGSNGQVLALVGRAETPTVTMPRVKALMTGSKPSFLDIVRNLDAPIITQDNLLSKLHSQGKHMVFYGDDTWVKMFPTSLFIRYETTSSFLATDYTTVDTNVTDRLKLDITARDWDLMVLHYLGVDHIGHTHGGFGSPLIPPKLLEMDAVVKLIVSTIAKQTGQKTLFLLTGDHGMTDIGNHGGNTRQETDTAVFLFNLTDYHPSASPNFTMKIPVPPPVVGQDDVSATLSALMGMGLLQDSHGRILPNVLNKMAFNPDHTRCLATLNVVHLMRFCPTSHWVEYTPMLQSALTTHSMVAYQELMALIKGHLSHPASSLGMDFLGDAFSLGGMIVSLIPLLSLFRHMKRDLMLTSFPNLMLAENRRFHLMSLVIGCLGLMSTSFIEQEGLFWHYTSVSALLLWGPTLFNNCMTLKGTHRTKLMALITALLMLRLTLQWTNIWIGPYGIIHWLSSKPNKSVLSCVTILSFTILTFLVPGSRLGKQHCILGSGLFWTYLFRSQLGLINGPNLRFLKDIGMDMTFNPVWMARIVYIHIIALAIDAMMQRVKLDTSWLLMDDFTEKYSQDPRTAHRYRVQLAGLSGLRIFITIWILLTCVLSRVTLIPLVAIHVSLERMVHLLLNGLLLRDRGHVFGCIYLSLASAAFFSQGNTNAISSIDLAAGYVGLENYHPLITGFLVTCSTFSLFLFWVMMLFLRIQESPFNPNRDAQRTSCLNLMQMHRGLSTTIFMGVASRLRNHLFIWSVICPKILYEASFLVLINLVVLVIDVTSTSTPKGTSPSPDSEPRESTGQEQGEGGTRTSKRKDT